MSLHAVKMLGISVTTSPKKEILEFIKKGLEPSALGLGKNNKTIQKPIIIVTPNPEQVMLARNDTHVANILNQADVALPDGVGLVWASRVLSSSRLAVSDLRVARAIPGVEFMEDLVELAAKQGYPVALIGGRRGLAVQTLECLQRKHPKLVGWAEDGPELSMQNAKCKMQNGDEKAYYEALTHRITESGARIVFVGLGAPKQEFFIEQLKLETVKCKLEKPLVLMAVGGSFDIIAGRIPRAPQVMRNLGLEWLWRLGAEPWRLKRQLALLRFIFFVLRKHTFKGSTL
ncbi:hypothetical protein A3A64_03010 [Candidatus Gottesmanbacteria bacterium RIFCSPLOWO2_01_FULL_48_11]|uniref:Glycosyl transferase, WecB/TagA/CpsF family n=2 Tax=Candidatus Gottesmaniibacteriota TaxID=1752720 RepID=A0A0G1U0U6_9BACT|nr:MAG: Glycosyl transferase, WecB/TagA/CpsF family [Candidatus Gottesmanbacteria bacterium GW2011_GWA2_47_9]OGG27575.1 MAG: hypothetical protein A3A64_03010 [Candidatus Gottesmanbacteria bacterium RIFCSPLOWO2_01_FULL_48_11]